MATESHDQDHDLHHVPESWWLPVVGISTLLIGLGIFFIGRSLNVDIGNPTEAYIGAFCLILFFIVLAGALYNETSPNKFARSNLLAEYHHEELVKDPRGFAKFSFMWIYLASETLFFTIIIGASLMLRIKSNGYAPEGQWIPSQHLDVFLTAINTFVLILSSYTMVKALETIDREGDVKIEIPVFGKVSKTGLFLFATFVLGATFISIQGIEYIKLWGEGFRPIPSENYNVLFPATFYLQTGFHGLHVFFGVFIMLFVAIKAFRGGYTKNNHDSIELIGYYWHFVDLVWVFLFTIVYLF